MRPKIKDYFGENALLQQVVDTYKSQPELFNYAQALDWQVDKLEEANGVMLKALLKLQDVIERAAAQNCVHAIETGEVNMIEDGLKRYQSLLESAVEKTFTKGYKDFGLEGKMRKFVHELESKSEKIGVDKVLMLRRHEKDYLLRNEQVYIEKLSVTIDAIKTDILKNKDISVQEKDVLIVLLYNYFESFNALVHVGKEIGNRDEKGISEMVTTCKISIERNFEILQNKSIEKENQIIENLQKTYLMVAANILIVSALLIYLFFKYRKNEDHEEPQNHTLEVSKMNVAQGHLKQAQ